MQTYKSFKNRSIHYYGVHEISGYYLKLYNILYEGQELNETKLDAALKTIQSYLPQPSKQAGRPGIGFLILHQGCGADYLILGWWDQENELPLKVFVYDNRLWRRAREQESVCVWDIEVIWNEREFYVSTLLSGLPANNVKEYLSKFIGTPVTKLIL